jgi:rubrerythrin
LREEKARLAGNRLRRLQINYEKGDKTMLSKIPINLEKLKKEDMDMEILRAGIVAELDAINLYEQMAALTEDKTLKSVLLDIAKEEKTHVGEFLAFLLRKDGEQKVEMEKGRKEIEELIGK